MAIAIRKACAQRHADAMFALFEAHRFAGVRNARRALAAGPCELWLAYDGDRLVGALLAVSRTCGDGLRRGVAENGLVDRDYRRRGIGRRLLETAEAHYREAGLAGMEFAVRADFEANAALRAHGYAEVQAYRRDKRSFEGDVIRDQERLLIRKRF